MSSSDGENGEELSRLYIAEGDTCFRKQLYEKAVNAYSKSIYYNVDRNVLLNRSRCLVALGRTDEAIRDATDAIASDESFYSGFYQKAEAFYTGGQFENALAFYYKAYQRRPDVKKFQLGVQKAEEAILKAIDTCVSFDINQVQQAQNPNLDTIELKALIMTDFNAKNLNRCLCGCLGCDNQFCRDMYFESKICTCRCQSCLQHLCNRSGLISEPKTGQLIKLDDCLGTNSVNATATPATAFQGHNQSRQQVKPVEKQKRVSSKTALEKDMELLNELQNDEKLNIMNPNLGKTLSSGIQFINKRNEFWRQQGANEKKKSTSKLQQITKIAKVPVKENLDAIPLELTKIKIQMSNRQYQQAISALNDINGYILSFSSELALKMLSDVNIMLGCCYYELNQYQNSLDAFCLSLDKSEAINDKFGKIRALRCAGRALQGNNSQELAVNYYQKAAFLIPKEFVFLTQLCNFNLVYAQYEAGMVAQAQISLRQILTSFQNTAQPVQNVQISPQNDSFDYFNAAPVFFQDVDPLPEQLFQDTLCLAGLLDLDNQGEGYLQELISFSTKIRDFQGKKAGLQNLAHLYKDRQEDEKLKIVMEELDDLENLQVG